MTITLRPEQERVVAEAVRSGAYASPDEVVGRALDMLREQEEWLAANRDAISRQIEEGCASAQRGELVDGDRVRVEMEARKRAWLDEQHRG